MAQAEVERIEREITEAVRLAYYEVSFATRAIAIIGETHELVDDLTQVAAAPDIEVEVRSRTSCVLS